MSEIKFKYDCSDVDWLRVYEILGTANMASLTIDEHRQAFENSYAVVFAYDEDRLVGFCRAISDGIQQAALYNLVVEPSYQGRGLGRAILEETIKQVPGCNIIFFAAIGKEGFYRKQGFRKMLTGMASFVDAEGMKAKGFTD